MRKIQNFEEANAVLAKYAPSGGAAEAYTLNRMRKLMEFLGNPQGKLKIVHVAGTSGKTSTSYYAASLLKAAGFKVGLTISPHVDNISERLQVNLLPLSEDEFCGELTTFMEAIENSNIVPTYFELLIAMVYWEFAKLKVDYAVIEVGLGGLLDGTNVVSRADKVCVITDIALDHVTVLGNTLSEIATQKAGIIGKENVVFSYAQDPEITDVIKQRCLDQSSKLTLIQPSAIKQSLKFLPLFQQRNFMLAKTSVEYILKRDSGKSLSDSDMVVAAKIRIPGRMEIFNHQGKTIILDGAHNAQKLHALADSIKAQFPGLSVGVLAGFAANRDYRLESSVNELVSFAKYLVVTSFVNAQDVVHESVEPQIIATMCKQQGFNEVQSEADMNQALAILLKRPEPVLVITGSFYLLYNLRPLILELPND